MFTLLWVILAGLGALGVLEFTRRRLKISNEDSRKTYHLVHALIISAAPFLVSYKIIILLELVLLLSMLVVRKFNLFPWLYRVGRLSWGEFFGVSAVILVALLKPNKWVFLAAMLHFGIADALAAVVGKRYGKNHQFKVFGQVKSIPGSLTFYVTSVILTAIVIMASQSGGSALLLLAVMPVLATLAEAASPFGLDNFVIPILVTLILRSLQFAA
jgi:dolichol kinase